jgi:hypothetical protein
MRQFMMTVTALAAFGAMVAAAQAENQTRSPQDLSSDSTHPLHGGWDRIVNTCTGLKLACIHGRMVSYRGTQVYWDMIRQRSRPHAELFCSFRWEQCMKTGFWEGYIIHRSAERR